MADTEYTAIVDLTPLDLIENPLLKEEILSQHYDMAVDRAKELKNYLNKEYGDIVGKKILEDKIIDRLLHQFTNHLIHAQFEMDTEMHNDDPTQ
jgi:hypothetical protein